MRQIMDSLHLKREHSKGRVSFFLVVFLAVFSFLGLCCEEKSAQAAEPVVWKPVRIASNINRSLYVDEEGIVRGYCADFIKTVAKNKHWIVQYVPGDWNTSVDRLLENKVDLLLPCQKTPERMGTMDFSALAGGYQPIALYTKTGSSYYFEDYASFNGARVAVAKNSSNEFALREYAAKHNFTFIPVYIASTEDKLKALDKGEVDLISVSTLAKVTGLSAVAMLEYEPFYFAVAKGNTALLQELDSGMKHVMATHPNIIADMYIDFLGKGSMVAFTKGEHEWIQKHKKMVIGVYKETPPLYHNPTGKNPQGIYVDLIKNLSQKTGIELEFYEIDRDKYAYNILEDGTIDLVIGSNSLSLDSQRNGRYIYSNGFLDYITVAVSKLDYDKSNKKPVYVLTEARKYWETYIKRQHPDAQIKLVKTSKDCLLAVQEGNADVTLLNTWEYNFFSKNARFNDLLAWESDRINGETVMVGLSKANPHIMSIMDKAMASLTTDETDKIISNNLNKPYDIRTAGDYFYANKTGILVSLAVLAVVFGSFVLMTNTKRKYIKELEEKNTALKESNAAKSIFLSRMSHELKTPLNIISGNAFLLKDYLEENAGAHIHELEQVEAIGKAEKHLLGIIDGMLAFQNLDLGKVTLAKNIYNVQEFLEQLKMKYTLEAEEKGIKFVFRRLTTSYDICKGDGAKVKLVIDHLLSNAFKFTKVGGEVSFTISTEKELEDGKALIRCEVKDNGIGMSREFVESHLFQVFKQENENLDTPYEGTGLGLSLSRKIAGLLGGSLTCESKQGKGSTFIFTFMVERDI